MHWQKSVVGEGVFTHEAGIHIDGLLKHPDNYQGFDPQLVGREHRFVLGKHSGKGGVQAVYAGFGQAVADPEAIRLLEDIRHFVHTTKRPPTADELLCLARRRETTSCRARPSIHTGECQMTGMTDTTVLADELADLESGRGFSRVFQDRL